MGGTPQRLLYSRLKTEQVQPSRGRYRDVKTTDLDATSCLCLDKRIDDEPLPSVHN